MFWFLTVSQPKQTNEDTAMTSIFNILFDRMIT